MASLIGNKPNQVPSNGDLGKVAFKDQVTITDVYATGTPSATTFLRGDGTWTAPTGGQFFGSAATKAIAYNSNTIGENVTVTAGNNGLSAGPITISTGFTVTVETGAAWVIV